MKIYVDEGSTAPSPRRVRMYLAEKGIHVLYETLELHKDNRTREFRRKNPVGTLPVLELDDGTCISESLAICRYFEEVHPDPPLFGVTAREKAEVEMWTRRAELYLYLPIDLAGHFRRSDSPEAAAEFESWASQSPRRRARRSGVHHRRRHHDGRHLRLRCFGLRPSLRRIRPSPGAREPSLLVFGHVGAAECESLNSVRRTTRPSIAIPFET